MDGFDSIDYLLNFNSDFIDMISKDGFGLTPVEALDSISNLLNQGCLIEKIKSIFAQF